jgi:hypothetical protein
LLRFARALKDDVVILRKCPWGAMTTYKGTNYSMNFRDIILVIISAYSYYFSWNASCIPFRLRMHLVLSKPNHRNHREK